MLNDSFIIVILLYKVQSILHKQYPDIGGLQDTKLGEILNLNVYQNQPFIQVLHDGNIHWVAVSTMMLKWLLRQENKRKEALICKKKRKEAGCAVHE